MWHTFHPSNGILGVLAREHPNHLLTRRRYVWFPLFLACPILLIVVAGSGYVIKAVKLNFGFLVTVALIASGMGGGDGDNIVKVSVTDTHVSVIMMLLHEDTELIIRPDTFMIY